jgi:hypothetical protein
VEYEMVRAARANGHRVTMLGGPPSIKREWAPAHTGLGSGSFLVDGDTRLSSITNIHNMADKRNISASFNTRDYMCLGCNTPYSIAELIRLGSASASRTTLSPPTWESAGRRGVA